MNFGEERRLARVLGANRTPIIVAMDHSRTLYVPKLANPELMITELNHCCPDGILLSMGSARRYAGLVSGALLISLSHEAPADKHFIEEALFLGADAIKIEVFPESEEQQRTTIRLEKLCASASRMGIPVIAEVIPGGFDRHDMHTVQTLAKNVRIAAECGAAAAKIPLPTDGSLVDIVQYATIPIMILGGNNTGNVNELISAIGNAVADGASGVIVGRHIFGADHPNRIVAKLRAAMGLGNGRHT